MSNNMLSPFNRTVSFCATCYKKIPALLYIIDDQIVMKKFCSEHGQTEAVVEKDVQFYVNCARSNDQTIYPGYLLDVTRRCNLKCEFCYYPVDNKCKDISIDHILMDAEMHVNQAPFVITGGEPTLRDDLVDIAGSLNKIGPISLLTNGTGLDKGLINSLSPLLGRDVGDQEVMSINMSMHPEAGDDNIEKLELFRSMNKKIESILFVIDSVDKIDKVVEICEEYKDVICGARIKAATKVWSEQSPSDKIFVSDMLNYITSKHNATPVWYRNNKVSFFNVKLNDIYYMLVSWYDIGNVDILDINCAPYYQAKNGETLNLLTAMLVNEGISKGWLNGNRIEDL